MIRMLEWLAVPGPIGKVADIEDVKQLVKQCNKFSSSNPPVSTNVLLTDSLRTCWRIIDISTTAQIHQHFILRSNMGSKVNSHLCKGRQADVLKLQPKNHGKTCCLPPIPLINCHQMLPWNVTSTILWSSNATDSTLHTPRKHTYPQCLTFWSPAVRWGGARDQKKTNTNYLTHGSSQRCHEASQDDNSQMHHQKLLLTPINRAGILPYTYAWPAKCIINNYSTENPHH